MKLIPSTERFFPASPRRRLENLMERFFEDAGNGNRLAPAFDADFIPPINIADTEKDVRITVEMPGVDARDINIQLQGNQLVISAERKWEEAKKGKEYRRVEMQYGALRRVIELEDGLRRDRESITAGYNNGILEIRIQKLEPTPATQIPVKAG